MIHALCATHGSGVHKGAAQKHHACAQRHGLEHIAATADAAVHHHRCAVAHAVHHRGQHLQRGDHAIELAAAVVADHDALRANIGGHHGVFFVEDAFDDEVAIPALANALDMLPVQVVAARGVTDGGVGQQGRAACGKRVLEVRHAVVDERAQHGAHHPARAGDAVIGQAQ